MMKKKKYFFALSATILLFVVAVLFKPESASSNATKPQDPACAAQGVVCWEEDIDKETGACEYKTYVGNGHSPQYHASMDCDVGQDF